MKEKVYAFSPVGQLMWFEGETDYSIPGMVSIVFDATDMTDDGVTVGTSVVRFPLTRVVQISSGFIPAGESVPLEAKQ